jgi:hypothetical protein
MEGSGYSMLVGGYKQSGGEDGVKTGANASPNHGLKCVKYTVSNL